MKSDIVLGVEDILMGAKAPWPHQTPKSTTVVGLRADETFIYNMHHLMIYFRIEIKK